MRPIKVLQKLLILLEKNRILEDHAEIRFHGDGMWCVKSTHQNQVLCIWLYVKDLELNVNIDGETETFNEVDHTYYGCAKHVVQKITSFLNEWKK